MFYPLGIVRREETEHKHAEEGMSLKQEIWARTGVQGIVGIQCF